MTERPILLAAAALILSACATEPVSVAPLTPIPAAFSQSGEAEASAEWWRDLDDPALDALIETGLADNPSLRATWDRLTQARAVGRRAGADRLPSLDFDGSAGTSRDDGGAREDNVSLGLAVSYEVDLWGRVQAATDAARFDAEAARYEVAAAAVTLSAEIARRWYELIEQRRQLDLLERQIAINRQVLDLVSLRFRQGQAAAADVLRQRQLVEATQGNTSDVRASIQTFSHELAILIGKAPGSRTFAAEAGLVTLPPLPETGVPSALLARRPDVRQAFYQVQAANARVAAAIADQYPRFDLAASVASSVTAPADLFSSWLANLAGQLMAPLFDGGARAAEVDRSEAVLSESLNQYEATLLQALREVEDALAREARQREKVASLEAQLTLANQVIEQLRGRYIQGAINYLDVLDALATQQDVERQLLTARRTLVSFRIDLARALAGGWTMTQPEPRLLAGSGG